VFVSIILVLDTDWALQTFNGRSKYLCKETKIACVKQVIVEENVKTALRLLACLLFWEKAGTKLFTDGVLLFWELFGVGSTEYSYF